jgi:hypothetical protein
MRSILVKRRITPWVVAAVFALAGLQQLAVAQDPAPFAPSDAGAGVGPAFAPPVAPNDPDIPDEAAGTEVLNQGPVHEAFATAITYNPAAGPVVPREPPAPIDEQPPDQRPDGDDVQWIPGYWFWDDTRPDFIWVSGIWREPPPDCQWTPGYWNQCAGGWQWTSGCWTPVAQDQGQYLPPPPASVEAGPNTPPPADDPNSIWSPGYWKWCTECEEVKYVWIPGTWIPYRPDWTWTPPHYLWTPGGYLFVAGYWDYPLEQRGVLYAPVAFTRPCYTEAGFVLRPRICVATTTLPSCLFVQPAHHCYRFGDYFDARRSGAGIYPWYAYHQSHFGYDPLYAHCSAAHRNDQSWSHRLHDEYGYRRDNPSARPPQLFRAQAAALNQPTGRFPRLTPTASMGQLARQRAVPRPFVRLSPQEHRTLTERGRELHAFSQGRRSSEANLARNHGPAPVRPVNIPQPRSPIATRFRTTAPVAGARVQPHPGSMPPARHGDVAPLPPAPHTMAPVSRLGGSRVSRPDPHPNTGPARPPVGGSGIPVHHGEGPAIPSHPLPGRHQPPPAPIHPGPDHSVRPPGAGYVSPRPMPDHSLPPLEHRAGGHPGVGGAGPPRGFTPPSGSAPRGSLGGTRATTQGVPHAGPSRRH